MLEPSMLELLPDEITIEPFVSMSSSQVPSYGTAVTYRAQVIAMSERVIDKAGRELRSTTRVIIPDRVTVDVRSRLTLPSGWVPNQPPILAVRPVGGVGSMALDSTEILT